MLTNEWKTTMKVNLAFIRKQCLLLLLLLHSASPSCGWVKVGVNLDQQPLIKGPHERQTTAPSWPPRLWIVGMLEGPHTHWENMLTSRGEASLPTCTGLCHIYKHSKTWIPFFQKLVDISWAFI